MANYTENLNLEKPLQNEYYDIEIFNANSDKIDSAYKELKDKDENLKNEIDKKEPKITRSNSVSSSSETDVATSLAVKLANDNANTRLSKNGGNINGRLMIEKNNDYSTNYANGQLEIRCSTGDEQRALIGFHNYGTNAHSLSLDKDWTGIKVLAQSGSVGNLKAHLYNENGFEAYSPGKVIYNPGGTNFKGLGTNGFTTNIQIEGSGGIQNSSGVGIGVHPDGNTYFWNNKDGNTRYYSMVLNRSTMDVSGSIKTKTTGRSLITSKGYHGTWNNAQNSNAGFLVGDGDGGSYNIPNTPDLQFVKGYGIWSHVENYGYYAHTTIGHLRNNKVGFGSTVIHFEGDSAGNWDKNWEFKHSNGDFLSPGDIYTKGNKVYSPINKPTSDDVGLGSVRNVASYSQTESDGRYRRVTRKVIGNPSVVEYSDGYKEAWGYLTTPNDETYRELTLPVTFGSTNYALSTSHRSVHTSNNNNVVAECFISATNKIKYRSNSENQLIGSVIYWRVSGY